MKLALRQQEYGAQAIAIENEFAGQKIAVRMWESEQRRQIDDMELVTEEAKGEAKVELAKLTAARINEVNKRSAAADAATLKNNQALMSNLRLDALRNLASLSGSLAQITKKNFALSKVFSYSQAIINTAVGVTEALKLPFPYNLAAAAATGAAGAVQISAIASQKAPQAHAGLDYVPQEATYKLQRGEMVLDPGTSDAVRNAAMGGGGGGSYQLNIDVGGESLARILLRMSRDGRLQIASKAVTS
jgi:hypothetical protein